ncbi:MAG: bacteriohemerythrin [Nanoarchaeota archaeon]|nr:bacteriohemerythrin [Nanoarchaeota archaeon]
MKKEYEWKPSMSVGEKKIDSQHKKLLSQIIKLEKDIAARSINMGVLRDTNHFLYDYFKEHFSYEEKYMEKSGYPKLAQHRKVHESFIRFYDDFQRKLMEKTKSGNLASLDVKDMVKEVRDYLGKWLVNHIMGMDQDYARYVKMKG